MSRRLPRAPGAFSAFTVAAVMVPLGACPTPLEEPSETRAEARVLVLGAQAVADVEERYDPASRTLHRRSTLRGSNDDESQVLIRLDRSGFAVEARYERKSPRGGRSVELKGGALRDASRPGSRAYRLSGEPIVLLDALCHLEPPPAPVVVELVDLASGESVPGRVRVDDATTTTRGPTTGGPTTERSKAEEPTAEDHVAEDLVAEDRWGGVIARCSPVQDERVGPGAFVECRAAAPCAAERFLPVMPPVDRTPEDGARVLLGGLGLPVGSMAVAGPGQRIEGPELPPERSLAAARQPLLLERGHSDRDPPRAEHRAPALFFESDDSSVLAFAKQSASGPSSSSASAEAPSPGTVLSAALALVEAVSKRLDTSQGGGPPSAAVALERNAGDCDDATALLVASLRALGHAARPVVGYRAYDGRWVPHAWAEVWDGAQWVPADAMVPGIGPFATHLRLYEGLGSPLTVGRTLGALDIVVAPPP